MCVEYQNFMCNECMHACVLCVQLTSFPDPTKERRGPDMLVHIVCSCARATRKMWGLDTCMYIRIGDQASACMNSVYHADSLLSFVGPGNEASVSLALFKCPAWSAENKPYAEVKYTCTYEVYMTLYVYSIRMHENLPHVFNCTVYACDCCKKNMSRIIVL